MALAPPRCPRAGRAWEARAAVGSHGTPAPRQAAGRSRAQSAPDSRPGTAMTPLPRDPRHTLGPKQMALHAPGPAFLVELHQRLRLPQVVGIAKRMLHALHRPVALPVVVHRYAAHPRKHRPTPARLHDRPPARACPGPDPGMCTSHEANASDRRSAARSRPDASHAPCTAASSSICPAATRRRSAARPAHRRQRRRRHAHSEQNPQNLRQPALRKELPMTQPDRNAPASRWPYCAGADTLGSGNAARVTTHRNARSDAHDPDAP